LAGEGLIGRFRVLHEKIGESNPNKIFAAKDDLLNHGKFPRFLTFKWEIPV